MYNLLFNRTHATDHSAHSCKERPFLILLVYEVVCGEHLITAARKVCLNRRAPCKAERGEPATGEG